MTCVYVEVTAISQQVLMEHGRSVAQGKHIIVLQVCLLHLAFEFQLI